MVIVGLFMLMMLMGRLIGWSALPVVFLAGVFFAQSFEIKRLGWILGLGVFADLVVGSRFGLSSLMFILLYLEILLYKEMVGSSSSILSIFIIGVLGAAQATIFWGVRFGWWQYLLAGFCATLTWQMWIHFEKRGGRGVYLRQ